MHGIKNFDELQTTLREMNATLAVSLSDGTNSVWTAFLMGHNNGKGGDGTGHTIGEAIEAAIVDYKKS